MKKLDFNRDKVIGFGTPYAFMQDGHFFDQNGNEVSEDGTSLAAPREEAAPAPAAEAAPAAPKKPGPKPAKGPVDPTIAYERQERPKIRELRARMIHVSGGKKKLPAGTSIEGGKKLILDEIAAAAQA